MKTKTLNALELPPVKWCAYAKKFAKLSPQMQSELLRELGFMAERAPMLADYLYAMTHGDDHAGAVKTANRKLVKVRRALGFTYPEKGQIQF